MDINSTVHALHIRLTKVTWTQSAQYKNNKVNKIYKHPRAQWTLLLYELHKHTTTLHLTYFSSLLHTHVHAHIYINYILYKYAQNQTQLTTARILSIQSPEEEIWVLRADLNDAMEEECQCVSVCVYCMRLLYVCNEMCAREGVGGGGLCSLSFVVKVISKIS